MIRLHMKPGLIGQLPVERRSVEWSGQSAADLVAEFAPAEWPGIGDLMVGVDGLLVTGEDLLLTLPADCDVVVAPRVHGAVGVIPQFAASLFVIREGLGALIAIPDIASADRGDERSPTYAWDGVQTNYGQGFLVPIPYGENDLGGQVIYTSVFSSTAGGTVEEELLVILALGEGRFESIGDVTGNANGEVDGLNGLVGNELPANIRVNNNLLGTQVVDPSGANPETRVVAEVWLRMGALTQAAFPTPFDGARTTFSVNERLDEKEEVKTFTYVGTESVAKMDIVVVFPNGVFESSGGGAIAPYGVGFQWAWRPAGLPAGTGWSQFYDAAGNRIGTQTNPLVLGTTASETFVSETVEGFFDAAKSERSGPIEVRLSRGRESGGPLVSSSATWRQLVVSLPGTFTYPNTAGIAMKLPASEKVSGSVSQYQIRAKCKRIRAWDPILGWSPETWEVPAAPFNFHQYPVGNNPAWVLLDYLLSLDGESLAPILGVNITTGTLTEENINLFSFRAWSIYCDSQPGPSGQKWSEPRFRCDLVIDRSRPAQEWILAICSTGRATIRPFGNKIGVSYQYRDAHSDEGAGGYIPVSARGISQMFCDANVKNVEVEYLDRGQRPTLIEYQYVNRDLDFRQDTLPVEETESYLAHLGESVPTRERNFRKVTKQAYGRNRSSQLFRDAVYEHRAARLIRKRITFDTGIWALAAQTGDLIGFQHDVLRPFSSQAIGLTIRVGGDNVTQLTLDRTLTASGGTDKIVIRAPKGEIIEEEVTAIAGPVVTLANPVSINAGAPCAFGVEDEIYEQYEVVKIGLTQDLMRPVTAVQYVPEIHDEPPAGSGGSLDNNFDPAPEQANVFNTPDSVDPDDITISPSSTDPSKFVISWAKPAAKRRARCRVYARPQGTRRWWHLGEVRSDTAQMVYEGMGAWQTWEVMVGIEDDAGTFPMPGDFPAATIEIPEFPPASPPPIRNLALKEEPTGFRLTWDATAYGAFHYYEAREGTQWVGAKVLYQGRDPFFFHEDPPRDGDTYFVAIRSRTGLYSLDPAQVARGTFLPAGLIVQQDVDETPPTGSLPTELEWDTTNLVVKLKDGQILGTYEAPEIDLGFTANAWWSVSVSHEERDGLDIDDATFDINSGEARWRTPEAREASAELPGMDWDFDDASLTGVDINDVPLDLLVSGQVGAPGSHTVAKVESRFYVDAAWTSWERHQNGYRRAQKMQARVTLGRDSYEGEALLTRFSLTSAI